MTKRALSMTLLLVFLSCSVAYAQTMSTPQNSSFEVQYPNTDRSWHLEQKNYNNSVRLNYLDQDNNFIVSILQSPIETSKILPISLKTKKISLNGTDYYFTEWVNDKPIPGGKLSWKSNSTYFEMDSNKLSKDEMIEIAKTLGVQ